MAELLNVDPKEEDFDGREEFPGTVHGQVFVCLFGSSSCCVAWYLIVYFGLLNSYQIHST